MMKKLEIRTIEDPDDIVREIDMIDISPSKVSRNIHNSTFDSKMCGNNVLKDARLFDQFFELSAKGGSYEIDKM